MVLNVQIRVHSVDELMMGYVNMSKVHLGCNSTAVALLQR